MEAYYNIRDKFLNLVSVKKKKKKTYDKQYM